LVLVSLEDLSSQRIHDPVASGAAKRQGVHRIEGFASSASE
jgi:hypothetical protein